MRKFVTAASTALLFGSLSLASAAMAGPGDRSAGTAMSGTQNMAATPPANTQMNDHDADDAANTNTNSNNRYSSDRDKGLDRAEDRASAEGREHGQAFQKNDHDADDQRAKTDADDQTHRADADDRRAQNDGEPK